MSAAFRAILPFFGIGVAGADAYALVKGGRRAVIWMSVITFALLVAAANDQEWVVGGLEYVWPPNTAVLASPLCTGCGDMSPPPRLGAVIRNSFLVGLSSVSIDREFDFQYSGIRSERDCLYNLKDYIAEINAAAVANDSAYYNIWSGLNPIPYSTFEATLGLLAFAAVLQGSVWILLVLIQYEVPIVSHKYSLIAARAISAGTAFFAIVAISVFGASPIKSEFCRAFEPDGTFDGLSCGYGNGFNNAIAGVVFACLTAGLAAGHMSLELGARYEFTSTKPMDTASEGFSGGASAPSFQSPAYQTIGAT